MSLIVFLLMCNNFCNTMHLPETPITKSDIQKEQYPRIVNPDALTTAKRYGSTLSPEEFDRLVYGKKPYFGSDYELCVPDVHVDLEAAQAYEHMFFVWKMLPAIFENSTEFNQDVINVIKSFYSDICNKKYKSYRKRERGNRYPFKYKEDWVSQKLLAHEHLIERNLYKIFCTKALSNIEQRIARCKNISNENNVVALRKLYDDQDKLSNNDTITHQNIIRCMQWYEPKDQWWKTNMYGQIVGYPGAYDSEVGTTAMNHLQNKGYNQDSIASLYEKKEFTMMTPVLCFCLNEPNKYTVDRTSDSIIYIRLNENYNFYIFEGRIILPKGSQSAPLEDPRYNPEIHGPERVVWFKYPHEKDFDAGLKGKGSSWMHTEEAEEFLTKQFEQLENMSNTSLRKDIFKRLAIKNGLLLGTVGLGIVGNALCMTSNPCSIQ